MNTIKMLSEEKEKEIINNWITTRHDKYLMQLIKAFQPLVMKYVKRYRNYGFQNEELIAIGNLALVETANRFDPSLGNKFSTFSDKWIEGMMLIFIASNYFSFSFKNQKIKRVFFKLRREIYEAQKENKDMINIMEEMAVKFNYPKEKIEQIYAMICQPNLSLDENITKYGDTNEQITLGDTIKTNEPDPEENIIEKSMNSYYKKIILSSMKRVLTERERIIIEGQILTEKDKEQTLQDLADKLDLSRERIRQIRNTAYQKLVRAIKIEVGNVRNLF